MQEYNASRNTIRKAISILVDRGYIYQVQGSGIIIRETSRDGCITLGNIRGLTGDFKSRKITTKLLDLSIINAEGDIAKKFKCEEGTEIYVVKRLRNMDGEPFAIECAYYYKEIIQYLNKEIVRNSIYDYILNHLKLNIGFADKTIYAEKLSKEESELLLLEEGEPALVNEDVVFLTNGLIFNVSKLIYNYKTAKMISQSNFR